MERSQVYPVGLKGLVATQQGWGWGKYGYFLVCTYIFIFLGVGGWGEGGFGLIYWMYLCVGKDCALIEDVGVVGGDVESDFV